MQQLGNRLKQLRLQHHLTQQQIAQQFGYAISAISSYESGQRTPSFDILLQYARLFHVSTDYLLGLSVDGQTASTKNANNVIDVSGLSAQDIAALNVLVQSLRHVHTR